MTTTVIAYLLSFYASRPISCLAAAPSSQGYGVGIVLIDVGRAGAIAANAGKEAMG
jgi:hypothetical protein